MCSLRLAANVSVDKCFEEQGEPHRSGAKPVQSKSEYGPASVLSCDVICVFLIRIKHVSV